MTERTLVSCVYCFLFGTCATCQHGGGGLMAYTAASQGGNKYVWLHFCGAVVLSILRYHRLMGVMHFLFVKTGWPHTELQIKSNVSPAIANLKE